MNSKLFGRIKRKVRKVWGHSLSKRKQSAIVKRIFSDLRNQLVIVDVGAQDTGDEMYQSLIDFGLVERVVGFEPLEDKAKARNEAYEISDIRPVALGSGAKATFNVNDPDTTSSLLPLNFEGNKEVNGLDHIRTIETSEMQTVRIDDVPLPEIIDLIKLDVQGFEKVILDNGQDTLARTSCIFTEAMFQPIYQNQPSFGQLFDTISSVGFDFHQLHQPVSLASVDASKAIQNLTPSRIYWADAVFMRPTRTLSFKQSYRLAAVAHFIFDAHDVAYDLLAYTDIGTGKSLAEEYAACLN